MNRERALLSRFLNGRLVSFDVDRLLAAFEPYHSGIDPGTNTLPLTFPDFPDRYEIRFDGDVANYRRTTLFQISLPIRAPAFWFCIHCIMRDDFVSLIVPATEQVLYACLDAPRHFNADLIGAGVPTRFVESVPELLSVVLRSSEE